MPTPAPTSPWLSILLPVYGVERYLPACLASLLAQDLDGVELVFLDDASRDRSAALLAEAAAANPGLLRLLRHPVNGGISRSRNTLLDAARGEYLWFVDPDDVVRAGAVASLREVVRRHAPDLVMCDYRVLNDDGSPPDRGDDHVRSFRGPSGRCCGDRDALVRGLFRSGKLHPWSKVVRRAAWPARLRFPDGCAFEDLSVYPRVALAVKTWIHLDERWIDYRCRPGSAVNALTLQKLDDWMRVLAGYPDELRAAGVAGSAATHLAIAQYWARTWMHVGRLLQEVGVPDAAACHRRYAALWQANCAWTPARLERAYWLGGRFARALRWGRWWRQAGTAPSAVHAASRPTGT